MRSVCASMTKHISRSKQHRPRTIGTLPALKRTVGDRRAQRDKIALVPTMGALHAGHISWCASRSGARIA